MRLLLVGVLASVSACRIDVPTFSDDVLADAAPIDGNISDGPMIDGSDVDAPVTDGAVVDGAAVDAATDATATDAAATDAATTDAAVDAGAGPTMPLLRRPLDNTYIGSSFLPGTRRPSFAWTASSGAPSITYELQVASDAAFSTAQTFTTAATTYQHATDLAVAITPPVGRRYYWRVRACSTGLGCSAYSQVWKVNVGRARHDVNGDGYGDAAGGAPDSGVGGANTGRVIVFHGGPNTSFDATADGTINGTISGDAFGISMAAAGDLNGDGFADLVAGTQLDDAAGMNAGRAWVYFGGASASFDSNPDGILAGPTPGGQFASSLAGAGDVNGDGFDDLVAGAHAANGGRAYLFLGGPGNAFDATPDAILAAPDTTLFGISVSGNGDVNADGFADVIVTDFAYSVAATTVGAAFVFLGSPNFDGAVDRTLTGVEANSSFGCDVATGDFNTDGASDIVVGARDSDAGAVDAGRAYVYFGNPSGVLDTSADGVLGGGTADERFGWSVASAGDVNGDGFDDVVVGAPVNGAFAAGAGRAYVYFGSSSATLDPTADGVLSGASAQNRFSETVSSVDINGDLLSDVLVGEPYQDEGAIDAGRISTFYGAVGSTFEPTRDRNFSGLAVADRLGRALQ